MKRSTISPKGGIGTAFSLRSIGKKIRNYVFLHFSPDKRRLCSKHVIDIAVAADRSHFVTKRGNIILFSGPFASEESIA